MELPQEDSGVTIELLQRIAEGHRDALADLLETSRPALRSFIEARLDPRIGARVDPSDIVQETQLMVARRIDDFLQRRPMPFRLWVLRTARERLIDARRHHLGRACRSVRREIGLPSRSSVLLARPLLARGPSPSEGLELREFGESVVQAVAQLSEIDQEILLMRHGEGMPFEEIALVLDIEAPAARKRFGRALLRLQKLLTDRGLLESHDGAPPDHR